MLADTHHDYLSAIKAQEVELGTLDIAEFGVTVDGIYFYKNAKQDPDFMSADILTRSLFRLIANHYPFLVGRPAVNSAGKAVIKVDPDNLNMPSVEVVDVDQPADAFFIARPNETATSGDPVKFFDLKAFYRRSGTGRLPLATYHKDHSAVVVRVLRFKCNSYVGLSYCMSHAIFDATGTIDFMNSWAAYACNVDDEAFELASPPLNDRRLVSDHFDAVEPLPLEFIRHFKDDLPRLPMEFPKDIAPLLIQTPDFPVFEEQHLLHVSAGNLEQMRRDIDSKQTTYNVLASLLAKSILQANAQRYGAAPTTSYIMIPYDTRSRSGIPRRFSGNASSVTIFPFPSTRIKEQTYKELAEDIKGLGKYMESGHTKAVMDTIENDIGVLYQSGLSMCNSTKTSNVRHMAFYTIDFGYGPPEILSFDYYTKEGMVRMQDGGVDLFMNYADASFEQLRTVDDLMKYVDVIF
ncbi:hypothetical protein GQ54DRAFT_318185 [Martensiomyces pterosporus]|nr:hypothetical protein GQ54DRAFT_318185 [Martensiomyces pterosporus]